jgi:hypothetical protein
LVIARGTKVDLRRAFLRHVRFLRWVTRVLGDEANHVVVLSFLEKNRMKTERNAIVLLAAAAFGAS